jgi:hypothetical protein
MSDRNLPHAEALNLASAALHARAHDEPHPDSEDAVRHERRRVSKELESIHGERVVTPSPDSPREAHARPTFSLRSHNTSLHSSVDGSREELRRYASTIGGTSTQADTEEGSHPGAGSLRSGRSIPHWYDPIVKFWTSHISLIIDEGAHRDHLGTSFAAPTLTQHQPY